MDGGLRTQMENGQKPTSQQFNNAVSVINVLPPSAACKPQTPIIEDADQEPKPTVL